MKKILFYLVLFLIGILNGYILTVSLGYIHSFDISMKIIVGSIHLLKEYNLSCLGRLALNIFNAVLLIITAIPIFSIFGFILTFYFKLKALLIGWINSIGILILFVYVFIKYNGSIISLILDSVIIILLNIYIITKAAKTIEARTKA